MNSIRITAKDAGVTMTATLNDTETARKVFDELPIEGSAQVWGDEIYFEIPVQAEEDDAQAEVPSGTIAYWPSGRALCIFFGQTPYSPVNVVGKVDGDEALFAKVGSGDTMVLEKA